MRKDLEVAMANAKKWGGLAQKWTTIEEIEPEIPADAVVHVAAYGFASNQNTVWIMSNKGLHVFRRGMLKSNRSGEFLPIHLISGISFSKSLMTGGGLKTSGPQSTETLERVDTKTAEVFAQKVKDVLASQPAAGSAAPVQIDVAEQIRKLGGLLADGLITQDEFDAKKAKLLDL